MRQFTSRALARLALAGLVAGSACAPPQPRLASPPRAAQFTVRAVQVRPASSVSTPRVTGDRLRSPDGRSEAYFETGVQGLESTSSRLMAGPVGAPARAIAQAVNPYGIAWHPESGTIAFSEGTIVHLVDSDGQTRARLYSGPGGPYPGACFNLVWSADGRLLSCDQVESVEREELANPSTVTITVDVR